MSRKDDAAEALRGALALMRPMPMTNVKYHAPERCAGKRCCIHNPSAHQLVHARQQYRLDRNIVERVCQHGVGHPDPDDLRVATGEDSGLHGCCAARCCGGVGDE